MSHVTGTIRRCQTITTMAVMLLSLGSASCGGGSSGTTAQVLPELKVSVSDREALTGGECVTLKSARTHTAGAVTWSMEGQGSQGVGTLSATTGDSVAWCPPASSSTTRDTKVQIRARSGDITEVVSLSLLPPAGLYTVAGDMNAVANSEDAVIRSASSIAVGNNGHLYVHDEGRQAILEISANGGVSPYVLNSASFQAAAYMAADPEGNLYIAGGLYKVFKIKPTREIITLGGLAPGSTEPVGDIHISSGRQHIARDTAGNVYVSGNWDKRIRKITPDGNLVTVAGTCLPQRTHGTLFCKSEFIDGSLDEARFSAPSGIAVDNKGIIYVADSNTIRKIDPNGFVTTLAGTQDHGNVDGLGRAARFSAIESISVDESGTVYAVDVFNASIRKITSDGQVSTIARIGKVPGPPEHDLRSGAIDIVATGPHSLLVLTRTSVQRLVF